jgi:hypothetical protein
MAITNLLDFELRIDGPEGQRVFKNARKGLKAFSRDVGAAISTKEVSPIIRTILKRHLELVAEAMVQRHSTPWAPGVKLPRGETTGKLAVRSGRATTELRDIKISGAGSNASSARITGSIGGPHYLTTHEDGKRITKTGTGYMTIPLPAAMDSHGVPLRISLRQWQDTFLMPLESTRTGRKRKGFVVAINRGGRVVPIYILVKSVRIPKRLGLAVTLKKSNPALVDRVLNALAISVATRAVTGRRVNPHNFGNF